MEIRPAPFFSVIIPVYNNEADLEKCISSVLAQTCGDFELILVDDGSTDRSPQICDEFSDRDDRVLTIHRRENGGAAAARNEGLAHASGKYICHVDGDDWIAKELLERAKQVLDQTAPPDIFVFCYVRVEENGKCKNRKLKVEEGRYDKERLKKEIYPGMIYSAEKTDSGSLCDKIIKKGLLEKHYCRDVSLLRGEDSVVCLECLYFADEVYFSGSGMYFYNRASGSSGWKKYHADLYENYKALADYLRIHLKAEEDFQIARQINALEFWGMRQVISQELRFHHPIFAAGKMLKEKARRGKKKCVCTGKGLPLRNYPYILLLNLHCFRLLMLCVLFRWGIHEICQLWIRCCRRVLSCAQR